MKEKIPTNVQNAMVFIVAFIVGLFLGMLHG